MPTGRAPCGIAGRAGSLWIGVYEAGVILQLDAMRGRTEARVSVGRWACRVAVGPAAVWVTRDRAGELVRVSRGTGRIERLRVGAGAFDVLLARRSVWTTSYDTGAISRIATGTRRVLRVFKDGGYPAGLTLCRGRIWIGHGREATWLSSIDPDANSVRRFDVGVTTPSWPRCVGGDLWVTAPGTILKVDASTGAVLARLSVGGTPAEAGVGPDGLVWVTDKERSLIHRIRAQPVAVIDSFPAGPGAFSLARAGASMWVTSFAGADVRRFDP